MRSFTGVDLATVLRARGLRATRQRVALSPQAGYDVLAALTGAGVARRVEPAGSRTPRAAARSATSR